MLESVHDVILAVLESVHPLILAPLLINMLCGTHIHACTTCLVHSAHLTCDLSIPLNRKLKLDRHG